MTAGVRGEFDANLRDVRADGVTNSVSSPLWGGVRGGGRSRLDAARAITLTPLPNPPPQGGREHTGVRSRTDVSWYVQSRVRASCCGRHSLTGEAPRNTSSFPLLALVAVLIAFGIFVALFGKNPLDILHVPGRLRHLVLLAEHVDRAAPLILTALCTALPAQLGLVIGGEARCQGALAATSTALLLQGAPAPGRANGDDDAGMTVGGAGIALSGGL